MKLYTICNAAKQDFSIVAHYHRLMFEEISRNEDFPIDLEKMEYLTREFEDYLEGQSLNNGIKVVCAKIDDEIVGAGCLTVHRCPPTPKDYSSRAALIHSIYVIPKHRKKGIARSIFSSLLDFCSENKIKRLQLTSSMAGMSLYKSFGFESANNKLFKVLPQ